MPPKAASRTIRAKKESVEPKSKAATPAQSEADWLRQEASELPPIKRGPDIINEAVGREVYLGPYTATGWKTKSGHPFRVTRFYPHAPAIAFDKPQTEKDHAERAAFFTDTHIVYLAVKPNEAVTVEEMRGRLAKALAEKKRLKKAA